MKTGVLAEWFRRGLAANPDGAALRVSGQELTYRELSERARRLAAGVVNTTGTAHPRVGILANKTVDAYVGALATASCGGTIVPLNPGFPVTRLSEMARAAGVTVLVADAAGVLARQKSSELAALPVAEPLAAAPPSFVESRRAGSAIAYCMFTSGSTGRPKGVPIGDEQVDHYLSVIQDRYRFTAADVFSQTFDLTFDLAMFDIFAAWGSGGTLVAFPSTAMATLPRYLAKHGVTVWFSAPSAIALARRFGHLTPGALPSLRWSLFCGEPLLGVDAARWRASAPFSTLENLYGPTELTISSSAYRWDPDSSASRCVNGVVPIGALHRGLRAMLLDEDGRRTSSSGELCVSGPQNSPGYLDQRDDDGRFFEADGHRWYRTGDLVRYDDYGDLVYLGRRDSQVQVRGCRIELAEVDHAVSCCKGVERAVTVQRQDGDLHTFYTGEPRDETELVLELATSLQRELIPKHLQHIDAFPLNANGKTDRATLRTMADDHRASQLEGRTT